MTTLTAGHLEHSTSMRMERTIPDDYRLGRRPSGELVLQGCFFWRDGLTGGHEWRDIKTVDLPGEAQ